MVDDGSVSVIYRVQQITCLCTFVRGDGGLNKMFVSKLFAFDLNDSCCPLVFITSVVVIP